MPASEHKRPLLLENDESMELVVDKKDKSTMHKCIKYSLIPLDILIYPLTCCMRSSCWNNRKYAQYDLSLQLMGIFQTLIGALWASTFVSIIEHFDNTDNIQTVYIALYSGVAYVFCNILVVMMQRKEWFKDNILFFVGTLGHIVAFGIKSLAFQIMNVHFSSSFKIAVGYFWTCLAVSIFFIYGLSFIRKHFCFAMS